MQLSLFGPEPTVEKTGPAISRFSGKKQVPTVTDPVNKMKEILARYLPDSAIGQVAAWLVENQVQLRITNSRITKLGDYRPPRPGRIPVITINHNLNHNAFLVTLVHEMAHHTVMKAATCSVKMNPFKKIKKLKPHGLEWQEGFRTLMEPYLHPGNFPAEVLTAIRNYLEKPKASTTADRHLYSILKKYDDPDGSVLLEKLPEGSVFQLPGGRRFRKGEKVRTRYKCVALNNEKVYLFNPMAHVFLI